MPRETRLIIIDWLSRICLIGAVISFILEIVYGDEIYQLQTLGFILGWLAVNEVRMKERFDGVEKRFDAVKERMNERADELKERMKDLREDMRGRIEDIKEKIEAIGKNILKHHK